MGRIITQPKIELSPELLEDLKTQVDEIGQVIIHCLFHSPNGGDGIRIWPTTYLFDKHSDHVSTLALAERITTYPVWTITKRGNNTFTLIFTGLPKSCSVFDLIEDCNGASGSFKILNIRRTTDDVYYVQL